MSPLGQGHWKPSGKGGRVGKSEACVGARGESQCAWLSPSCYLVLISSGYLSLPPSLKDFSPILFNAITLLYFLHNPCYHLKSFHYLFARLFAVCLPLIEGPLHEMRVLVGFVHCSHSRTWNIANVCLLLAECIIMAE